MHFLYYSFIFEANMNLNNTTMKKILMLFTVSLFVFACKTEPKDYVTVSGKITNVNELKKITIQNRDGYRKEITVNDDGTFSDTLKVVAGTYLFNDGNESASIYLKNDNITSFTLDTKEFDETLKFTGGDADKSNFYVTNSLLQEKYLPEDLMTKSEAEFDQAFDDLKNAYAELKDKNKDLDSSFYASIDKDFDGMHKSYKNYHNSKIALLKEFPKGKPSPSFENYENHKGGTTSLADLKGKYVYVDVWATWCGPCKREIPSLKKVEEQYHGKNIEFVSISVDDERRSGSVEKANTAWRTMVAEKELGGIQLFSDKAWQSDFIQGYKITGIPRFILIDPNGNIVSADAPRPSNPKLIELFNELNI